MVKEACLYGKRDLFMAKKAYSQSDYRATAGQYYYLLFFFISFYYRATAGQYGMAKETNLWQKRPGYLAEEAC